MTRSNETSTIATTLREHPRLMGALFTMALLVMEAGNAAANAGSTTAGP